MKGAEKKNHHDFELYGKIKTSIVSAGLQLCEIIEEPMFLPSSKEINSALTIVMTNLFH